MADARPAQGGTAAVVGSTSLAYNLQPVGPAIGAQLATMTIPSGASAGGVTNDWENVSARCEADNGQPGDVDAVLRLPESLDRSENGLAIRVVRMGESEVPAMFLPWGFNTGDTGRDLPLANGESLTVIVRYPDDGTRPHVVVQVGLGPLSTEIEITVSMTPDVSMVRAALAAIQADLTALHAEDRRLENEFTVITTGEGTAIPPVATESEVEDGTGMVPRIFTVERIWQAITARVSQSWLANIVSGFVRSASVSDNTLSIVHVRPDGSSETITFTPEGSGGGGITAAQARDAAGALLSTLDAFTYTAGPPAVLTFTPPAAGRPSNITLSQLAQAVQDLINSKVTAAQVDARVFTDNGRLTESRLPKRADDILDAFSGDDGWTDNTDALVRRVGYTTARPANIGVDLDTGYVASYLSHPRESDIFKAIALPTGDDPNLWRLNIGSFAAYRGNTWTLVEVNDNGRDLYTVRVTDIPVGETVHLQSFSAFTIADATLLGFRPWVIPGNNTPIPANLLVNAPSASGVSQADVDARINALRPNAFTNADSSKLDSISAGAEVNPRLATDDEIDAGVQQAARTYSPAGVQRQIEGYLPVPADPADNGKAAIARSGEWAIENVVGPRPIRLINGSGVGLSVASAARAVSTGIQLFTPVDPVADNFDLDDAANQRGIVFWEAIFTLQQRTTNSLGFGSDQPAVVSITRSGLAFISDIRVASEYSASAKSGYLADTLPTISTGTTEHATIEFRFERNASNQLGYTIESDPAQTANTSYSWVVASTLRIDFYHNDASGGTTLPALMTRAEAEAGTEPQPRQTSPQRQKQAIDALQRMTAADKTKLDSVSQGAERNVQADWTETSSANDSFIRNKPTNLVTQGAQRFTPQLQTKLAGVESGATADQSATEIRDALQGLSGAQRLDATAVKNLPQPGGGGLASVNSDATLTGLGTSSSALSVANPFTDADETKLDGVATGATRVLTSDIDGRIISTARSGNTARWPKAKMPSDTIYTGTQRFTTALQTKLAGVEANAKDDQTGTEIVGLLEGLSGNSRLNATAIRNLPSGGGGLNQAAVDARIRALVRSFLVGASPSTTVSLTTGTTANVFTAWTTVVTLPTVLSSQAGYVELVAHFHAEVTAPNINGGGDRVVTNVRIQRNRGSLTIIEENFYGPRNVSNVSSRGNGDELIWKTTAQTGDVFTMQVQVASQMTGRTVEFNTTQNGMQMSPVGL